MQAQSAFRIFRLGQNKPTYIYRLVSMNTIEHKIFDRGVTKMATSKRVIDEEEVDRHYLDYHLAAWKNIDNIEITAARPSLEVPNDSLLANLLDIPNCIYEFNDYESLFKNSSTKSMSLEDAWKSFSGTLNVTMFKNNRFLSAPTNSANQIANRDLSTEKKECLYGFKSELFLDVLFVKAKKLFSKLASEIIWKEKVPLVLENLYESMDKGETAVFSHHFS